MTLHSIRADVRPSSQTRFDLLSDGSSNDKLFGEDGNDQLFGGDYNDLLLGGGSVDLIHGGKGTDTSDDELADTRVAIEAFA